MKIGLIDVDSHNFPNLALMKLSAWHKKQGDTVEWWRIDEPLYDRVYMAKVFSDAYSPEHPEPFNAKEVIRGGSGYAIKLRNGKEIYHKELDPELPYAIEHVYPDYSLYPKYTGYGLPLKKQTAFGFLTRGCPRACEFWHGQGLICLSDPNILACKESDQLLKELDDSGAKIEFNQGLDARFITPDTALMLVKMKIINPHFAMDNMKDIADVERGLVLYKLAYRDVTGKDLDWRKQKVNVFVLVNYNTTVSQDLERIMILRGIGFQPYVMIYNKPSANAIYRRLQRWTNNPMCWASANTFDDYQLHTYKEVLRID